MRLVLFFTVFFLSSAAQATSGFEGATKVLAEIVWALFVGCAFVVVACSLLLKRVGGFQKGIGKYLVVLVNSIAILGLVPGHLFSVMVIREIRRGYSIYGYSDIPLFLLPSVVFVMLMIFVFTDAYRKE